MSGGDGAAFLRGLRMQELGRHEDAIAFFKEAIAQQADHPEAHARLALSTMEVDGRRKEALGPIDSAIALDPENGSYHAIKSLVLNKLNRAREAVNAASAAVGMDPNEPFHHAVLAQAYMGRQRWADAEESARRALALDGDHTDAQNILAMVLRLQGKLEENSLAVDHLLAENPEDEMSHLNAGYAALQRLDDRTAERHFREALRIDPEFDAAREGLLEAFRARSTFYRLYLRYSFFMQRFTGGKQWMIIIGIYLAFRFGRTFLNAVHPALGGLLVLLFLLLVLWVWLARGLGGFIILCDRSARLALKTSEKWEALFVGGALVACMIFLLVGSFMETNAGFILALTFLFGAIPSALVFTNPSRPGRVIFGSVLVYVYLVGLSTALIAQFDPGSRVLQSAYVWCSFGALAVVATTWLGNIPSLRRE